MKIVKVEDLHCDAGWRVQFKPTGPTSNPDQRVPKATKSRAGSPPSLCSRQPLMNDPG
jgi:hypothetical protein